jgi:CDGSH-type Zn-finger protein
MITNLEEHNKKAAKILKIENDIYHVLLINDNTEIQVGIDNLKKKKMCSCGLSQNKYFCDASHLNA